MIEIESIAVGLDADRPVYGTERLVSGVYSPAVFILRWQVVDSSKAVVSVGKSVDHY